MKKLLIILMLVSTPVFAEWGTVVKSNACGNIIIKTEYGMFVAAKHSTGYSLQFNDKVHGRFFSQGIKNTYTDFGKYSMYWIYGYGGDLQSAEYLACQGSHSK